MSRGNLDAALASAPPSRAVDQTALEKAARDGATVVILDDDPTGTQTVGALPIVTRWEAEDLRWAFDQPGVGFCVLTNTRSLGAADARARNADVVAAVHAAAAGRPYVVISRGDSTLRGHHIDEIDEVGRTLAAIGWGAVDAVLVVPAFPDARRITVDSTHWIVDDGEYLPAGESSFARDATFGYRSSDLREWTEERSAGAHPAATVQRITLDVVRGPHAGLVAAIVAVAGGAHVVVDAADENDLRCISAAAIAAEAAGRRLLYRTSPGLLRSRLGQQPNPPLSVRDVAAAVARATPDTAHGLVVVGSHVPLSSRQLARLLERDPGIEHIVLDVPSLLDPQTATAALDDVVQRAASALLAGDVVLSTSRARVDGADGDDSLRIARTVSQGIVAATAEILRVARPSFLIGKGGITSSDLATGAVGLRRATILGSLLPGMVSVWQSGDGSVDDAADTPYAVFPGNVGGDDALAQAVAAFRAGANSTG
ncbi:uncharacterized protein YgbK (DUF1537 family) [Conyzicola lurida]|uniref:Uncharacterized protein YgbK (DUF1537 family) n=1 Tax=Conyzicola lurida TaxID=1172621 RepID=A0A841AP41_9MICO|nr:four-carbon acid sugar kinase family protein [Conyzicola lurida]MBB5844088.1 uncharacterized protein YgbK (DUF1537 family) [Conyzicola lurida]